MSRVRSAMGLLLPVVVLTACISPTSPDPSPTPTGGAATADSTPTPTPTPTPVQTTESGPVFGTGTVTVDGTALPVAGDCDISRDFGDARVADLEQDVDVLLAVDNLRGDGSHDGPFVVQVTLLGSGPVVGRSITSTGAPGASEGETASTTYEGEVEAASLQDRQQLEFLDAATLHLEATQQRTSGSRGPETRSLVVDVTCPIARPG